MLKFSQQQVDELAAATLLRQVRQVLLQRTSNPAVLGLLAAERDCYAFWRPLHDPSRTDYDAALRLATALVARSRGEEVGPHLAAIDAAADPEHTAKLYLETAGAVRYSEFDIA